MSEFLTMLSLRVESIVNIENLIILLLVIDFVLNCYISVKTKKLFGFLIWYLNPLNYFVPQTAIIDNAYSSTWVRLTIVASRVLLLVFVIIYVVAILSKQSSQTNTAATGGSGALNAGTAAAQLRALAAANPSDAAVLLAAAGAIADPTTTSTIVPNGSLGTDVGGNSGWTGNQALVASGNGVAANTMFINMTQGAAGNLQDWAHEGTHNANRSAEAAVVLAGGNATITNAMTERNAYSVTQTVLRLTNTTATYSGVKLWDSSWSRQPSAQRDAAAGAALNSLVSVITAGLGARANNFLVQQGMR